MQPSAHRVKVADQIANARAERLAFGVVSYRAGDAQLFNGAGVED